MKKGNIIVYISHKILKEIKSRMLRWTGLLASTKEGKNAFKKLTGKPKERDLSRNA
jgi:hypothetical protein